MATPTEHYEEAERLLREAGKNSYRADALFQIEKAKVHAILSIFDWKKP